VGPAALGGGSGHWRRADRLADQQSRLARRNEPLRGVGPEGRAGRVEGQGEDYGVYAKGIRHRLTVIMKPAGDKRTSVAVERALFKRERILWMDKDEPVVAPDQKVEKDLIAAIERAL